MDIILKSKNGFTGRIIDVMVENDGKIMVLLESIINTSYDTIE